MIAILLLIIVNAFLIVSFRQDPILVEVKEKYKLLREHLISTNDPKFKMLHKEIPIVAYREWDYCF